MFTLLVLIYHATGTQQVEHYDVPNIDSWAVCHRMGQDLQKQHVNDRVEFICVKVKE